MAAREEKPKKPRWDEFCRAAQNLARGAELAKQGGADHNRIFEDGVDKPPGTFAEEALKRAYRGISDLMDSLPGTRWAKERVAEELQAEADEKCNYQVAELTRK